MYSHSPITAIRSCDQNYILLVFHNKSQIPSSNLNFVTKGRVISWRCFTFYGSVFAVNKMGMRVPLHKLLGILSHCM